MAVPVVPQIINVLRMAMGRPEPTGQLALLWLMATACEKDLPLDTAVDAMAADAKGAWKFRLEDFAAILRRGVPIQIAVQQVPDLLPPEAVLAAKVGASAGTLGQSLRAEAERQSEIYEAAHSQSILGVLIYVAAVLSALISVTSFLMVWIVPKFKKIFDDFDIELPAITQSLIDFADSSGPILLIPLCLGAIIAPILWLLWSLGFRYKALNLRNWYPRLDMGAVLRQLGVVVQNGQPIVDGLHIISTQHPNTSTWKRMSRVYEAVKSGEEPWKMMQHEKLLRTRERGLLESAERAGNLGWALMLLGRQIESKQDHRIRSCFQLVRPVCIGLGGLFVAWVACAMFLPLVKLIGDLA